MAPVVGVMCLVDIEGDRVRHLDRSGRYLNVETELVKTGHEPGMESGDRHGLERKGEGASVAVGRR